MATGVHFALDPGSVGQIRLLRDVEGVHVGAQSDGAAICVFALEHADNTGLGQTCVDLDAERAEQRRHHVRCALFLVADFRIGVY